MPIRSPHSFRCAALVVVMLLPVVAQAAKEKFVRSKPHVNIGTIGHVDTSSETLSFTLSLVGLPAPSDDTDTSLTPRCSGSFDIRVLDSKDLGGAAVFELPAVQLAQDESATVVVPPSSMSTRDPSSPLLYELTAKGEHIDGRHCVFRGLVEVQSLCAVTRTIPLRPEDFILLGKQERELRRN